MSSTLKVLNAILCEDVRREINGKHTIIGAVSHGFLVASFPASVRIAAYLEILFPRSGQHQLFIRVGYGKEKDAAIIKAELEIGEPNAPIGLPVPSFNLAARKAGNITMDVSQDEVNWKRVLRRPVKLGDIPNQLIVADERVN